MATAIERNFDTMGYRMYFAKIPKFSQQEKRNTYVCSFKRNVTRRRTLNLRLVICIKLSTKRRRYDMLEVNFHALDPLYEMAAEPANQAIIHNSITAIQSQIGSKNILTCIEENTELIVELTYYLQGQLQPFHLAEEYVHCFFNIAYMMNLFQMEPITDEERINYIKSSRNRDMRELFKNASMGYLTTHVLTIIRELSMIGKSFSKYLRGKLAAHELRNALIAQDVMLACISQAIPIAQDDIDYWMKTTFLRMSQPINHK